MEEPISGSDGQQDVYGSIVKEPDYSSSQGSYEPNEARDEDMTLFDQVIINTMREHNIKGGSVIIGREGKILYRQGYGQDSAGLSATSTSKFPIGDISKVITAMAVLKLKELGYLELSDEVMGNDQTSILKLEQKKNKEKFDRRKRKAHVISRSVQHLLQHTAGWDAAEENDIIGTRKLKLSRKITNLAKCSNAKELVMRQMMFRPPDFQPGTKQVYCHLNYLFLGLMIEELTGMSYMDFITDMFHCLGVGSLEDVDYTEDLQKEDVYLDGLQNIKFCVLKKHEAPAKFLHGTTKDKRKEDELFLLETAAYCGLVASAEQLFKIFSSVELSLFQRSVLSKDSVTQMLERPECCPDKEWYGLGLKVSDNGESWGHFGRIPEGTHSLAFRDQSGITWTVLFSQVESGSQTLDIELGTMMRHALSVTPRFSSYSSVLFKHVSFLGMEVSFYGMYSSHIDQ
uniref:Beta-lactamase-related domain-containing protein n=1 Tax=Magallana gigas TaxID=29159 RepID=A0A8W8J7G7_MAGGI